MAEAHRFALYFLFELIGFVLGAVCSLGLVKMAVRARMKKLDEIYPAVFDEEEDE